MDCFAPRNDGEWRAGETILLLVDWAEIGVAVGIVGYYYVAGAFFDFVYRDGVAALLARGGCKVVILVADRTLEHEPFLN